MFNDRENLIGALLLGLCAVVGVVLVWQIATGERLSYNGPSWLAWVLLGLFAGGVLYGLYVSFIRNRGSRQWPDPSTGRPTLWDRIRGKGDDRP